MIRNSVRAGALAALTLPLLWTSIPAIAGPSDYVHTPRVEEGEREIDFKLGTARNKDGTRESAWSLGLGYGVNSWWFTEFYGKWHKEPGERHAFDAWEWENKFQLTETGKYPVDVGFLLEIERPRDRSEGYEYKWGPLVQGDVTPMVQANFNVLVEKHVRAAAPSPAELQYQGQLKYRWRPDFEYGLQALGELGPVRHLSSTSDQSHTLGPALFGQIRMGQHEFLKYNAAVLFGATSASPHTTFRLQTEYEF